MTKYLGFPLGSIEYVRARVRLDDDATDPTGLTVEMAVVPKDTAVTGPDWKTAAWEVATEPPYRAFILVGPGGAVTPTVGHWDVWLRLTDLPEIPIRLIGRLAVN